MEPVSTALGRGDLIGIAIASVLVASAIIGALWKAFNNEKQRSDTTLEVIKTNSDVMKDLALQIRGSVELATRTNESLLQTLTDHLKK